MVMLILVSGTHVVNTEVYSWDASDGHVNPRLRYPCGQVVCCVNLGAFFKCFLQLGWSLTGVHHNLTLNVTSIFPECDLNIP
jgi:hypothetical protein